MVPRPTAYDFVKPSRRKMPTKRVQVEAFVTGAGLVPSQAQQVMASWDMLRKAAAEAKAQQAQERSVVAMAPLRELMALGEELESRKALVLDSVLVDEAGVPVRRASQELGAPAGVEQVMPEDFTGIAGSVNTLVVHGNLNVHHEQHGAGGGRDAGGLGDGRDDRSEPGGPALPRPPGLLTVALANEKVFRRFMLLLAFVAVMLLGIACMVIVAFTGMPVIYVLAPMAITAAAVVMLTLLVHMLRSGSTVR